MGCAHASKEARQLYWLEVGFTIAAGDKVKKPTVYAIDGLMVVGTAEGNALDARFLHIITPEVTEEE